MLGYGNEGHENLARLSRHSLEKRKNIPLSTNMYYTDKFECG